jgi:hypothetical protein
MIFLIIAAFYVSVEIPLLRTADGANVAHPFPTENERAVRSRLPGKAGPANAGSVISPVPLARQDVTHAWTVS